uniref:Pyridine nucleotide-disulfide oxidoreductase domain-containing protein 1 n=1 Tax=Glossina palpalis gambiensis TaxID=67801 RepID=A0A1B0AKN2_9MUSC
MISITRGISNILSRIAFAHTSSNPSSIRTLQTTYVLNCENTEGIRTDEKSTTDSDAQRKELTEAELKLKNKDRTQVIPVETSIRYLRSSAYQQTYGNTLIWELYRRNHKGAIPPRKTRKTCARKGVISTGNPCPICRDEYLVLDYRNLDLLRQFISPQTGEVLSYTKSGLCQKKHLQLLVAVEKAWDYGLLTFDVPFLEFDYREYYGKNKDCDDVTFLIVGGGIAGVTCAETLAICCPEESILLLTESHIIKTISNLEPIARYLQKFEVHQRSLSATDENGGRYLPPVIRTLIDKLQYLNGNERFIITKKDRKIRYRYLCLCTGGQPRLISENNSLVLGIRDSDSVLKFQNNLKTATNILLVGNGGIASELAHELKGVNVHWVIKDNHIASTFVDAGAAYFFQQTFEKGQQQNDAKPESVVKRLRYDELKVKDKLTPNDSRTHLKDGAALGPDWHQHFHLQGSLKELENYNKPIIHYNCQVSSMVHCEENGTRYMLVTLSTGKQIKCDFLVSATGVNPRLDFTSEPALDIKDNDGGIKVDEMMQTSTPFIYAAGDVCAASWPSTDHWFQMRLWTQARQMGSMAGRSMAAAFKSEKIYQDFCFELFGHVTQLFGYPVVLLGRYNGQDLGSNYELLLRTTPGSEYIKFVLQNGRLRGAVLIGNTELAETCENLILNGIDLTPFGDDILNPDIDIEDYFD